MGVISDEANAWLSDGPTTSPSQPDKSAGRALFAAIDSALSTLELNAEAIRTGILYTFDTGTADADPGSGKLRANNASLTAATVFYVSKTNKGGADVSTWLATFDDPTGT